MPLTKQDGFLVTLPSIDTLPTEIAFFARVFEASCCTKFSATNSSKRCFWPVRTTEKVSIPASTTGKKKMKTEFTATKLISGFYQRVFVWLQEVLDDVVYQIIKFLTSGLRIRSVQFDIILKLGFSATS